MILFDSLWFSLILFDSLWFSLTLFDFLWFSLIFLYSFWFFEIDSFDSFEPFDWFFDLLNWLFDPLTFWVDPLNPLAWSFELILWFDLSSHWFWTWLQYCPTSTAFWITCSWTKFWIVLETIRKFWIVLWICVPSSSFDYFIPERNAKQRVGIVFIKLAPKTQYEHEYIWLVNFMDKLGSWCSDLVQHCFSASYYPSRSWACAIR